MFWTIYTFILMVQPGLVSLAKNVGRTLGTILVMDLRKAGATKPKYECITEEILC